MKIGKLKKQFMEFNPKVYSVGEGVNSYTILKCKRCGMAYLDTPENMLAHQPIKHEIGVRENGRYIPIASTDIPSEVWD